MSENISNQTELLLREVLNETLLRDIFLFIFLYIFILVQGWDNLFLLLFPIISFSFALFFRVIGTNKKRLMDNNSLVFYNPIGIESKNADRLVFISLLQLILLFWIGAESIYHPQLIDEFGLYFNIAYFLIYSFGFYWIFIGIWNDCKIIIDLSNFEENNFENKKLIVSELKFNKIKLISHLNIIVFLLLNIINFVFILFNILGFSLNFSQTLPGTGIEDSEPLYLPYIVLIIMIAFPLITSIFLRIIYNEVSFFSEIELETKISSLPLELQNQIIENLKIINKKSIHNSSAK